MKEPEPEKKSDAKPDSKPAEKQEEKKDEDVKMKEEEPVSAAKKGEK